MRHRVDGRIVQESGDVVQRETEFAVGQHSVQTLDVCRRVAAVALGRAVRRHDETDVVVVVQSPHADPDEPGHLADFHLS